MSFPILIGSHRRGACAAVLALVISSSAFGQRNLCLRGETPLWSCVAHKRVHSLCASADLSASGGYLQYRVGAKTRAVEFRYPATLAHPKGQFVFSLLAQGVELSFTHAGQTYSISELVAGPTVVHITNGPALVEAITCQSATETLSLTGTIDRFRSLGISE